MKKIPDLKVTPAEIRKMNPCMGYYLDNALDKLGRSRDSDAAITLRQALKAGIDRSNIAWVVERMRNKTALTRSIEKRLEGAEADCEEIDCNVGQGDVAFDKRSEKLKEEREVYWLTAKKPRGILITTKLVVKE